ncbi:20751_t:CDS:2, partial [Racocetra persica]
VPESEYVEDDRNRVEYYKTASNDLDDRAIKKRTYVCEKAGKYKPKKSKPIEQQCNKGSKKTDCKWHINLSKPEASNYVYITFVSLKHNHDINIDNMRFAPAFRKFNESVISEIEYAVVYGYCNAYTIRNLLQPLFLDQLFLIQDLSNAIQKIKCEKKVVGSDASYLLKFLLAQQKEDPTMFVQPLINIDKKYPSTSQYLNNTIYSTWESWARVFINQIFTARMQSTQRVESINAIIHRAIASSSSMSDVVKALKLRFFSKVNNTIHKYYIPRIIEKIHKQICELVLYKCKKLDINDAFKFENDLDLEVYDRLNDDQIDQDNQEETIENIEDYYNIQQIYLKTLLNS